MAECIAEEVGGAEFGDQRLTKRLTRIAERFWQKPNMSIPAATDGRAEMEAAYRFFDNRKVTPESICETHVAKTVDRIRQTNVALLVQDTTAIDLTRPQEQVKGAGPIDCESRIGMLYHPLMAFDSEGLSLGTVWSKSWVRESIRSHLSPAEKDKLRKQTPIEDKESCRWLEGLRAARNIAESVPATQCVCIADSEADIYEFFAEPLTTTAGQVHLLIRGCYDRSLMNRSESLLTAARAAPCIAQCMVDVSRRESSIAKDSRKRSASRDGRMAEVEVRACSLVLRPPRRHDRELPEVRVNVVLVEEPAPPEGQEPIQWILVTTLPIDTDEQVRTIVRYYCIRWQIEVCQADCTSSAGLYQLAG